MIFREKRTALVSQPNIHAYELTVFRERQRQRRARVHNLCMNVTHTSLVRDLSLQEGIGRNEFENNQDGQPKMNKKFKPKCFEWRMESDINRRRTAAVHSLNRLDV